MHAVTPYTKKELLCMSLPDVLSLYSLRDQGSKFRNPLLYLYPDVPKDMAFGAYYTSSGRISYLDFYPFTQRFSLSPACDCEWF